MKKPLINLLSKETGSDDERVIFGINIEEDHEDQKKKGPQIEGTGQPKLSRESNNKHHLNRNKKSEHMSYPTSFTYFQ